MSTTYEPSDPAYLDEADLRDELNRVYDLCHGCRLCFKFCTAFPALFELVDRHDDRDASRLTNAEQHRVVDECFNCKLCYVNCPYVPGQHEWELDFPRLMLRAKAVQHDTRRRSVRTRLSDQALSRTDRAGRIGSATAPLTNRAIAKPGSATRKVLEKVTGLAAERVLPPFAKQRFSTWFRKRSTPWVERTQAQAAVFPTCLVEYQDAQVGKDLVRVYERNGVECSLPVGLGCCGAPRLHNGDVEAFRKQARKNLPGLAAAVRAGNDIVVAEPTCGYVLKFDYRDYLGGGDDDAELVAAHTYDAAEYLASCTKATAPRSTPSSRDRCPTPSPTTLPATCGPRTSASRAATSSSSWGPGLPSSPSARRSTAAGGSRPRTTSARGRSPRSWSRPSTGPATTRWLATARSPMPASSRRPARRRSTPCRCWPGPTASPRTDRGWR
ncbi:MAG: heterodisulfide reductase-related iron-sulfur binding cluster [Acidimicrobiales bacterium]